MKTKIDLTIERSGDCPNTLALSEVLAAALAHYRNGLCFKAPADAQSWAIERTMQDLGPVENPNQMKFPFGIPTV